MGVPSEMKQCKYCENKNISRGNSNIIEIDGYTFRVCTSYCVKCGKVNDGDTWVNDGEETK